jgi:uncharacterized protein
MIAAFARAARVLVDSPHRGVWRGAADRAADAVRATLRQADGRLFRRYRDGEASVDAFNEDYAYLVWGLLELFEATGDARRLEWALELTAIQTKQFFDAGDGGWFSTTGDDPSVLLRLKEDYDGAEPSAASITVRNLLRLAQITGDAALRDRAQRTLQRFGPQLGRVVKVMPFMVANLALWHAAPMEVVIVGDEDAADRRALERAAAAQFVPWAVTIPVSPGADQAALGSRLPWIAAMSAPAGRAAAYVCEAFACQTPTSDPAELQRQMTDRAAPRRIIL